MDDPSQKDNTNASSPTPPKREIGNAGLFANDIIFSDTEKILFEEDLQQAPSESRSSMMDGNPEDRYSVNKKLNQGGMKAIWEVDDHRTARKVAMALIQSSKIASEDDIDSFLYEARLTANLQHPNIIPIYDIALDENGNPYFTMKALRGETLGSILKKLRSGNSEYKERYTRTRMLSIFLKVCNAVDYAHTKGVIHLDLKPSNINIGDFGEVHVLDWGLSTLITHLNEYDGEPVSWQSMDDVALEDGQTLTRYLERSAKRRECNNVVGGTPGYMSPEQAQGVPSDIDFHTDVYMLGSVLYEILTYQCPIKGETVKDVLHKTVRGEVTPLSKAAPENRIPPALAAITRKAMAIDPSKRYPGAAALIRDIHKFQDGFATSAENPTFFTHTGLLIKRHKLAVSLIGGTGIIIAAILARSFNSIQRSEQIAVDALTELQKKNEYIASTARRVAPDYLRLMKEQEKNFDFAGAEYSLNTGLAFDPNIPESRIEKVKILLCNQQFSEAWKLLTEMDFSASKYSSLQKLVDKYKNKTALSPSEIPGFVKDFRTYGIPDKLPRLFFTLNQSTFNPDDHFKVLSDCLSTLNPNAKDLNFNWSPADKAAWTIDISNNPNLSDITPLCGLNLLQLNAEHTGAIDLSMLTENTLTGLNLNKADLNHLSGLDHLINLQSLDISETRIKNISVLLKHPNLTTLNISNIEDLEISPQLILNQKLKMLTVSEKLRNDPTVMALARRGVIVIYTGH